LLFLLQSLLPGQRLLIVRLNLQDFVCVGHRIIYIAFELVNVTAVKIIADLVWIQLDCLGIIRHRFVVIVYFHFDCGALLIDPRFTRADFKRRFQIENCVPKSLIVRLGERSLFVSRHEIRRIFVIKIERSFQKTDRSVPILVFVSLAAFTGQFVGFRIALAVDGL